MPESGAHPDRGRATGALAAVAGLACLACCLAPALITAGVLGASAAALVGWLPALAVALVALAVTVWWVQRRRSKSCSCADSPGDRGCA